MPQSQASNPESGLRDQRIEFIRENGIGDTPADPSFLKYSDTVQEVTWSSDAVNEPRRGIGDIDPIRHTRGPESHEVTVTYDLVKWFTDGSGNANDAAYDGLERKADNTLPSSHTFVQRSEKQTVAAENTVSGNTSYGTRVYSVGRGGLIDEVTVSGDPSEAQPVTVELSYVFQKVRTIQLDQPYIDGSSDTDLIVKSTDAGDTSQSVTLEGTDSAGTSVSDTLALNGTSNVVSSNVYATIDTFHVDAETVGDVELYINSGTSASPALGDQLSVIYGSTTYGGVEGDLGIPPVGTGSHESLGSVSPELFLGDVIQRSGSPVPHEIQSMTITAANNVDTQERVEAFGLAVYPGTRELTAEATMFGETTTHDMLVDHLTGNAKNISWQMTGGTIQLDSATLTDPGERAAESGTAVMTVDNSFTALGLSFA